MQLEVGVDRESERVDHASATASPYTALRVENAVARIFVDFKRGEHGHVGSCQHALGSRKGLNCPWLQVKA